MPTINVMSAGAVQSMVEVLGRGFDRANAGVNSSTCGWVAEFAVPQQRACGSKPDTGWLRCCFSIIVR